MTSIFSNITQKILKIRGDNKKHFSSYFPESFFNVNAVPKRYLNIQEFQSKILLDRYQLRIQKFGVASTPIEAENIASDLNSKEYVVKAQILAGGRGKGEFENGFKGGVHLCNRPDETRELAEKMLGYRLITNQTTKSGVRVRKLMIAESININRELYVSIVMDRESNGPVYIVSRLGGVDIEKTAEERPEMVLKHPISISDGPTETDLNTIADFLEFETAEQKADAIIQLERLYNLFIGLDATDVEINPFAVSDNNKIYCVDTKIGFDDNAIYRHPDIYEMRDVFEEDQHELTAQKYNLNYVSMEGNIGCLVNGAGLAMATMDIIELNNGNAANFLDISGGADQKSVTEAFKILNSNPQVKAILVNIFGGIVKCDIIAEGIVNAAKSLNLDIPLIVRLEGTNIELGKKILRESGLSIISANGLDDAARKAVNAIN